MSEFKPIETQEQFDALIKERLERAKASVREEFSDYDQLKQQVSGYQSQIEELKTSASEKDTEINGLKETVAKNERDSAKIKAALANGIPVDMASRISGEDEESINKDAEAIAKYFKSSQVPPLAKDNPVPTGIDAALLSMSKALAHK